DEDGAAHGGDGVGGAHLDLVARAHLVLGDGDGDLAGVEVDGGAAGELGDGEGRALADGDDGAAAEEEAGEGAIPGDDTVVDEDVVLELEGDGLRRGGARGSDVAFQGGGAALVTAGERRGDRRRRWRGRQDERRDGQRARGERRHCGAHGGVLGGGIAALDRLGAGGGQAGQGAGAHLRGDGAGVQADAGGGREGVRQQVEGLVADGQDEGAGEGEDVGGDAGLSLAGG